MRLSYLDTSAAMKLLFEEAESQSLADVVADQHGPALVSSWLLHTELHCASRRRGGANPDAIAMVLDAVNLVDVTRGNLVAAGALAPSRSQDAIHLAVALSLGIDEMITYDMEMADAARRAGLRVLAPTDSATTR